MNPPKDGPGLLPASIHISPHDNCSCSCSPSAASRRTELKVKQSDRGNSTKTQFPKAPHDFTSGLRRSGQHSLNCISEQGFRSKYSVFVVPVTPVTVLITWFSTNKCVVIEKKVILIPHSVGAAGRQCRK